MKASTKPKGKPKTPPSTEERAQIATMAAAGLSQQKIAASLGRSRHMVRNVLNEPETQQTVRDERQEQAQLCREKFRAIVTSIDDEDISKASLQQKAVSAGILLDKSLLLTGEVPPVASIQVLITLVDAIRSKRDLGQIVPAAQALTLPLPVDDEP